MDCDNSKMNEQVSSPKSVESGGSGSKFKTLKKKIRNKFRLSRGDDVKTISQAVEALKRSDELLAEPNVNPDVIKNEFKELKNTLESIINQNQVLAEVMKSVDSTCPDPFNEPEKFSVYFAQKSISINSLSDEFEEENQLLKSKSSSSSPTTVITTDVENALGRLQNLRMEEQRGFQIERENFETRLGQLALLQQEIELLRKENSEHEIQIEFLKSQNNLTQPDSEIKFLKSQLQTTNSEITAAKSEIEGLNTHFNLKEAQLIEKIENLTKELENLTKERENLKESKELENLEKIEEFKQSNEKLKVQLEEALLKFKTLKETLEGQEEKERQFREISEENVRLKIEFDQLKRELSETRTQLTDLEKEPISSITLVDEKQTSYDESAFKYVYLSNLVLKFLQFPDQRVELSNIILTTLQADQPHFQKVMNMK